jgi:hypothetical protein
VPIGAGPLRADTVVKVGEGHLGRNNRIAANKFLNRYCASGLDLESILLARTRKILLQQYLPHPDMPTRRMPAVPPAPRTLAAQQPSPALQPATRR